MKSNKYTKWFLGIAVAFFLFARCTQLFSVTRSIRQLTDVQFTSYAIKVASFDQGEGLAAAKYTLVGDASDAFIAANDLKPFDESSYFLDNNFFVLPEEFQPTEPSTVQYYWKEECSKYTRWQVLFVPETNELWVAVSYPDWSGSHHGCDKSLE